MITTLSASCPILTLMVPSRKQFAGEPVFEELVEMFVLGYTEPGGLVLDPFAGSGSTIAAARQLGRRGLGVEIVPDLAAAAQERLGPGAVVEGDARQLADLGLPIADLVVTSPPFMTVSHHPQNPLTGYRTLDGEYAPYVDSLGSIVSSLSEQVRSGGRIVLSVWNFWHGDLYTPLADDVERTMAGQLPLEHVVEIVWGEGSSAPVADRCLVYQVP
jgi:tRNA G10  N-methylase Trm11